MQIPPFFYVLAFWQALAYIIAALVAYFTPYKLEAGIVLALFLAVLKMFNIAPEVRAFKAALEARFLSERMKDKSYRAE